MSSSSVEISFDTSTLLDSHTLDASDFLGSDFCTSPTKKDFNTENGFRPCLILSSESTPDLKCLLLFSSELFLMTQHLREDAFSSRSTSPKKRRHMLSAEEGMGSSDEQLRNDKIEKLLSRLGDDGNEDYEMDSDVRSRAFPSRFSKKSFDAFDLHLDNFLQEPKKLTSVSSSSLFFDENKENLSSLAIPSKRKLVDSGIKTPFRKKRSTPPLPKSGEASGLLPASIIGGSLRPNLQASVQKAVLETSPHRICVPRCIKLPRQPALKFKKNSSIFLVDSLTGSVSDATQFGTELNSSNCEGFPLPDDINEVVQIPTNSNGPYSAAPKMAIIKAIYGKKLGNFTTKEKEKIGFYSKREFDEVKLNASPQMTVYSDEKKVRWAEDLEW